MTRLTLSVLVALILTALRPTPAQERAPVAVTAKQERQQEQAETKPETAGGDIPAELMQLIASTERGTKVAVRQVAKVLRIGSDKATKLMQKASEAGLLSKTAAGYVAA